MQAHQKLIELLKLFVLFFAASLLAVIIVTQLGSCGNLLHLFKSEPDITVYPARDSVLQIKVDSILKLLPKVDSLKAVNDSLVANNKQQIAIYKTGYERKVNEIKNNPLDSSRINSAKEFLRSKFNHAR